MSQLRWSGSCYIKPGISFQILDFLQYFLITHSLHFLCSQDCAAVQEVIPRKWGMLYQGHNGLLRTTVSSQWKRYHEAFMWHPLQAVTHGVNSSDRDWRFHMVKYFVFSILVFTCIENFKAIWRYGKSPLFMSDSRYLAYETTLGLVSKKPAM